MSWYGHARNGAQIEAEAKRKAEAAANEANRKRKEEQAGGYHVVTTWPQR